MSFVWRFLAVTVSLGAVALAGPTHASDTLVGDFVVKLAEAKNLRATDSRAAVDALRTVGVRLPSDLNLDAPLTEGDVTRISTLVGLNVTSSQPSRTFGRLQVERFFASFSGDLSDDLLGERGHLNPGQGSGPGNGNGGPPFDPFSKGKGKHKGKSKQPQTPEEPE